MEELYRSISLDKLISKDWLNELDWDIYRLYKNYLGSMYNKSINDFDIQRVGVSKYFNYITIDYVYVNKYHKTAGLRKPIDCFFFQVVYNIDENKLCYHISDKCETYTDKNYKWTSHILLDKVELTLATSTALKSSGIYTLFELDELYKNNQLEDIPGIGESKLAELISLVEQYEKNVIPYKKEFKDDRKIDEIGLSNRTVHCLKQVGINSLSELQSYPLDYIEQIRNFGPISFNELVNKLKSLDITLNNSNESKFKIDYENIKQGLPCKYVPNILDDKYYNVYVKYGRLYINDVYVDTEQIGLLCNCLRYTSTNTYNQRLIRTAIRDLRVSLLHEIYPEFTQCDVKEYCKVNKSRTISDFSDRLFTTLIRLYKLHLLYKHYICVEGYEYLRELSKLFIVNSQINESKKIFIGDISKFTHDERMNLLESCEKAIFGTMLTLDNVVDNLMVVNPAQGSLIKSYWLEGKLNALGKGEDNI